LAWLVALLVLLVTAFSAAVGAYCCLLLQMCGGQALRDP
jgi:hypothetical protein